MPLTIYRSSAGSGKTFTLVKEYLKIVLQNPQEYKHILAITFTNKATEEMKTRIVEELNNIALETSSDMLEQIALELPETKKENLKENARKVLRNLLHNYSRFEVSTIDSFFTSIIRACARELNLPPKYTIDMDTGKALRSSIDMLYANLKEYPDLTTWLKQFTDDQISENKGWFIDYQIRKMGGELFKEKFYEISRDGVVTIEELKALIKDLKKAISSFENAMKRYAQQAIDLVKQYGLTVKDFRAYTFTYFTKNIPDKKYEPGKTQIKAFEGEVDWYIKKNQEKVEEVLAAGLDSIFQKTYELYEQKHKEYLSTKMVLSNIYSYGVLNALGKELKKYRDENNLLLISDTNALIKEIIAESDAPFILEKVGSTYKHILIDEFQDTSDYQWINLLPLVKNALSEDNHVLIVGDVKQSIYRWRGGNLKLLLEQVQKDLPYYNTEIKLLENNYRTRANIVHFNNAFFEQTKQLLLRTPELLASADLKDYKLLENTYASIEQVPQRQEGGLVKAQFFTSEKTSDGELIARSKDLILTTLEKDIDVCRQHGFQLKDMLVLVRGNKEAGEVAEYFSQQGIAFISKQSLLLKNASIIRLIIAVLEYLHNEFDPLNRSKLLYQYTQYFNIQIADHHLLFTDYIIDQIDLLTKEVKDEDATDVEYTSYSNSNNTNEPAQASQAPLSQEEIKTQIESLFKQILPKDFQENSLHIKKKSLVEIIEDIILYLNLNTDLDVYLQRFQDVCLDLATQNVANVSDFLDWWNENQNKTHIISPEGGNAVRIMTIHTSKGLEAPIVFLPFANYSFRPKAGETFWTKELSEPFSNLKLLPLRYVKDLAKTNFDLAYYQEFNETLVDALNIAYVAFTRAKDHLYIYSDQASSRTEQGSKLNAILQHILSDPEFPFNQYWSEDENAFYFGNAVKNEVASEAESIQAPLPTYKSYPFADKIKLRPEHERYYEILDTEKAKRIQMGVKVHNVMERLDKKENLRKTIDDLIRDRILKEEDREPINQKVGELLNKEQVSQWFDESWEVVPEQFILSEGELYKPDRIILKNKKAIVIDYKKRTTNPSHVKQIVAYGKVLEEMNNYTHIELYLVYVESNRVIPVHLDSQLLVEDDPFEI